MNQETPPPSEKTHHDDLKRTPLYEFHARHGARFVPFAGWDMPVQYRSILEEHKSVRTAAGLFDVSHMGEISVRGRDAELFLDYLVTNDVSRMKDGRALYSMMCNETGGVIDDLIIYRKSGDDFFLCVNAGNAEKDFAWIREHVAGRDCRVEDASSRYGLLALQGPRAEKILQPLTDVALGSLRPFSFAQGRVADLPVMVSRTGYTGEDGFELYSFWDDTESLAEKLLAAGAPDGLALAGLGARDSLRLEAGFPLHGHEISESIDPIRAGLGWTVKLKKENAFIGKEALIRIKDERPSQQVVFFRMGSRRIARPGTPVYAGDVRVGEVLSGTHSPILNEAIGSALIESSAAGRSDLAVDLRGKIFPVEMAKPPLHKKTPTK